jgi:hypothetical protein
LRMPRLTDEELALIAQALRSYSALIATDAQWMAPTMAGPVQKHSDSAATLAERIENARKQRGA